MSTAAPRTETKYQRLFAEFRSRIHSGDLQPGDRLPTIAALCDDRGVTPTTVVKVYSLLEQEALIVRRHGSGTYVAHKRAPITGRIGFIVTGGADPMTHPYWAHLLSGVQKGAVAAGKQVLFLDLNHFDSSMPKQVDGIIYIANKPDESVSDVFDGTPKVCVLARSSKSPSIVSDDFAGSMALTRHLIELGHRRIAMLSVDFTWTAQRRLEGYKEALREAAIEFDPLLIRPVHGAFKPRPFQFERDGCERMTEWLESNWWELGCTAVMAHNDETAIGAVQACLAKGLRVPEDISVAGFDGTQIGRLVTPSLTSVEIPLAEIGRAAVRALMEILDEGQPRFSEASLPTRLLKRCSTGLAPVIAGR